MAQNKDANSSVVGDNLLNEEKAPNAMLVSALKSPGFYSYAGRKMFADNPHFTHITINGLGSAAWIAVGAAALLEQDRQVFLRKVETSMFSSSESRKRVAKVTVHVDRNPNAPPMPPAVPQVDAPAPAK